MAGCLRGSRPIMRRTACLHHHLGHRLLAQEGRELRPVDAGTPYDAAVAVRDGDLKDILCEVDSDRRSIHTVSSLFELMGVSSVAADDAAEPGGGHSIVAQLPAASGSAGLQAC